MIITRKHASLVEARAYIKAIVSPESTVRRVPNSDRIVVTLRTKNRSLVVEANGFDVILKATDVAVAASMTKQ